MLSDVRQSGKISWLLFIPSMVSTWPQSPLLSIVTLYCLTLLICVMAPAVNPSIEAFNSDYPGARRERRFGEFNGVDKSKWNLKR